MIRSSNRRAFLVLALAIFSSTLGISMVSPILTVVAEDLGARGVWLGLSFSAFAVSQLIATIFIGRASDRWGRRPFIVVGAGIYAVSALGYALAGSFEAIIFWRFIAGFGTASIFTVAMAYLGDISPRGREGTYAGMFNVANFIGFGTGPLITGSVRETLGTDAAFWTMFALLGGTAVMVALLLPKSPRFQRTAGDSSQPSVRVRPSVPIRVALRDNRVRAVLAFNMADNVAFGAAFGFLALFMEQELAAGAFMVGIVFATRTWANGLLGPLIGLAADRYDRGKMIVAGITVAAIATFFIPASPNVWVLLVVFLVSGLGEGLGWPAASAIMVDKGRRYGMGALMGLRDTAMALGMLLGSLLGGVLADTLELAAAFQFSGAVMLVGAVVVVFFLRRGDPAAVTESAQAEQQA